jgi:hypothetical protein
MIDPTKRYQTRDGRPVRILATDRKHPSFPIVALVTEDNDQEYIYQYTASGFVGCQDSKDDLIPIPELIPLYTLEPGQKGILRQSPRSTWDNHPVLRIKDGGVNLINYTYISDPTWLRQTLVELLED